ncbi:MAG: hypothetical protein AB1938_01380 [Myxococcota bacterium]
MALDIRVVSPCSEKWESMSGDERKRFCAKCQLHVHDIASLTEREVLALFEKETGRVCGRLYRRADGRVMTADCPVGLARARRRLALVLTAATAMVLTAIGLKPPSGPACATDEDSLTLKDRVVTRYTETKEWLRRTETFGGIINKLDPQPPVHVHVLGKMVAIPPKAPPP